MRFIQHKREAYWFYRVISPLYDRWVNPLFWTPEMRTTALELARLEDRDLRTLDVGAGTGFSSEGIAEHVDAASMTLLDQSPDQLRRAGRKPALAGCTRVLGDAERLPFDTDAFDRYVSCGSIEYWPDPQRAIAEAYRVLRPRGIALVVGPLPPPRRIARWLADAWMLFPTEAQYREWFVRAGFEIVGTAYVNAPWQGNRGAPYGLAIAGRKPVSGVSPVASPSPVEDLTEPLTPAGRAGLVARFALGSLAALIFVPIGVALNLRARWVRGRS
jgi:MPBQ/MSBQ methyltransferase